MSQIETEPPSSNEGVAAELDDDEAELDDDQVEIEDRGEGTESPSVEEPEEERPSERLPLDQVFGILKNQRRRYVLKYLNESDEQVSLSELAEQVAAWENDKEVVQISSSERKRVYVGLYQCHLPKMDGMGAVSFNKPRGIVDRGEHIDELNRYLDFADEADDPPWHLYSVALSVVGAAVLGTSLLLRPLTTVPIVDLTLVFLVGIFLAYAIVNIQWIRSNDPDDEDAVTADGSGGSDAASTAD